MRARVTRSKKDRIAVFPEASKPQVKLPVEAFEHDLTLLEKMLEVTGLRAFPEDFLALNGEISEYGWQRAVQLAVYEKYNFLLPYLKQGLPKKAFKELLKEGLLDDFVYVYCCMLTLLLKEGTVETQAEEAAPDELLKAVDDKDMDRIDEILKKDIDEGTLRTAFSFAYRRWKTVKDASKPKFEQAMGKLEKALEKKGVEAADIKKIKGGIDDLLKREKEREKEQRVLQQKFEAFVGVSPDAATKTAPKKQPKEQPKKPDKKPAKNPAQDPAQKPSQCTDAKNKKYNILRVGEDMRGIVAFFLRWKIVNPTREEHEWGNSIDVSISIGTDVDLLSKGYTDDEMKVLGFLKRFVEKFPEYQMKITTVVWYLKKDTLVQKEPIQSNNPQNAKEWRELVLNLFQRKDDTTLYDLITFPEADSSETDSSEED